MIFWRWSNFAFAATPVLGSRPRGARELHHFMCFAGVAMPLESFATLLETAHMMVACCARVP